MENYLELLKEFTALKSVSTDPVFIPEMQKTAKWLISLFKNNGFTTHLVEGYGNPIVVAHFTAHPLHKNCLIYGHYDVQPAHVDDGWTSDPFILTERKGRLYARGAVDNKGQIMVHIATIFDLIKAKKLNYNITFLIEGDEETGSGKLADFIRNNKDILQADFALISDGEITACYPTLELGFRGVLNATITLTTSDKDLHSGLYGGAVPNAAHELTLLLSKMFNDRYTISIPEFYDDVPKVTKEIIKLNQRIPFTMKEFIKLSGTKMLLTEKMYDFHTQVSFRPTVQVTGIDAGYTGIGYRNSVPGKAVAKLNFRLLPEQEPKKILRTLTTFIGSNIPDYVKATLYAKDSSKGIRLTTESEFVERAKLAMREVYKKEPLLKHCGATLPIVYEFDRLLKIPQVLAPLANEDCRMHATDENYELGHLKKALALSRIFFTKK